VKRRREDGQSIHTREPDAEAAGSQETLKAVKHKRSVHRKYKDTSHPVYITAVRKACDLVKDARRNIKKCLAGKIKEDRKSFFAYVRSKSNSNITVRSLENENGQVISDSEEKAEKLPCAPILWLQDWSAR